MGLGSNEAGGLCKESVMKGPYSKDNSDIIMFTKWEAFFSFLVFILKTFYWKITYTHKFSPIINVQLDDFLQT